MSTDLRTIQRHLDERARAILDAVELLEKNGFSVQLNANGAASRGEPFPSARARSTAGMHAAPGESWPQAVDRILSSAPTPMSIDDLVTALIAQGKEFRGKTKPTTAMHSILHRGRKLYGWQPTGSSPRRWRKEIRST